MPWVGRRAPSLLCPGLGRGPSVRPPRLPLRSAPPRRRSRVGCPAKLPTLPCWLCRPCSLATFCLTARPLPLVTLGHVPARSTPGGHAAGAGRGAPPAEAARQAGGGLERQVRRLQGNKGRGRTYAQGRCLRKVARVGQPMLAALGQLACPRLRVKGRLPLASTLCGSQPGRPP